MTDKILVVEDDASTRAMLGLTLRQAGYQVRTAATGAEALDSLRDGEFGWLITDGHMLPMDGFELARRAKKLRPELRVVMVSAVYTAKDVQGLPIERVFAKPLSTDSIVSYLST